MNGNTKNFNISDDDWLSKAFTRFDTLYQEPEYTKTEDGDWLQNAFNKFNKQASEEEKKSDWISLDEVNKRIKEAEDRYAEISKETKLSQRNYLDLLSEKEKKILRTKDPQIYEKLSGGEGAKGVKELENLEYNLQLLKKTKKLVEAPEKGSDVGQIRAWLQSIHSPLLVDYATMGINELKRGFDIIAIEAKGNKNPESLSEEEKNLLTTYNIFQTIRGEKELKSGYNIGKISLEMIPYMITFAATGGIATGVKGTITGGMKAAEKGIVPLLRKIAGYTAGAGAQALAMPIGYIDFAERRISQYDIKGEGENLAVTLKGDAEPIGISALKSYATAFSEVFSEGLGAPMQLGVKKLTGGMAKNMTKGGFYGFINSAKKATKWNGAMYEWAEELINDVMQSVMTGDQPLSSIFDGKRQFEIFASCLMMGSAFKVAELPAQAQVYTTRRDYEKSEKKFREIVPSNISLQVLDAMDGKSLKDMGDILAQISWDKVTKEQQGAIIGYVSNRLRYDIIQGGIESDLDEKAQMFREKESGDIITAEDDAGNRYFINERLEDGTIVTTNAETFKKSMLSQSKLKNSASVSYIDWRDAQTETTLDELFQVGNAEIDQLATEENLKNVPHQIGENILYNGEEYTVTDISADGTLYTIPTSEELTEPLEITPDMYKYVEKSVQEGEGHPELHTIKVGKSFFQMRDEGNGLFSITQQFTDKKAANKLATELNDKFEGRGYDVRAEAAPVDPNDPFSDSVYTIRINTTPEEKIPEGEVTAKAEKEVIEKPKIEEKEEKPEKVTAKAEPKISSTSKEIQAEIKQIDTEPTEAQKEAGNYKMGHIKVSGMDITIENPKGSIREGKGWKVKMKNHYGYIQRTEGKDGDQIDVFIGKNLKSNKAYIIDQTKENGSFDEHKVMLGFNNKQEARNAYLSNYEKGWNKLGAITEVPIDQFREWAVEGTLKKEPIAYRLSEKKTEQKSKRSPDEIYADYTTEKENVPINKLSPAEEELLGRRVNRKSFERFGDPNWVGRTIIKRWFTRDGKKNVNDLDSIAQEISEMTNTKFTPQDIVEFIMRYPSGYVRKTTDRMNELRREYREVTGKSIDQHEKTKESEEVLEKEIINFVNKFDKSWFTVDDMKEVIQKNKKHLSDEKYKQYLEWCTEERKRIEEGDFSTEPERPRLSYEKAKSREEDRGGKGKSEAERAERVERPKGEQEKLARGLKEKSDRTWIEQEAKRITKDWNIPAVNVVQKQSDLPKDLQGEGKIVGVFADEKRGIYLIAENVIRDSRQASRALLTDTLFHEIVGHYGVRKVLGKNYDKYRQIIINLARDRFDTLKDTELLDAYIKEKEEYKDKTIDKADDLAEEDLFELGEELLAHLAEENPNNSAVQRIVSWLREQLRKLFPDVKLTNDDIISLLAKSRKYVTEKKPKKASEAERRPVRAKKKTTKKKAEPEVKRQQDYEFAGSMFTPEQMKGTGQLDLLALIDQAEKEKEEKEKGKPRAKKYIYPKQPNQLSETKRNQLFGLAKTEFGTTNKIDDTGWILPDGDMLNFHRKDSFGNMEHIEIGRILNKYFDIDEINLRTNYPAPINYFLQLGAIRINNAIGYMSFIKKPTIQQFNQLKRFFRSRYGKFQIDFGTQINPNLPFVKYSFNTPYQRIINDIRNYYNEGIRPNAQSVRFKRDPKAQKIKELIAESKKSTTTEERKREIEQEIMNLYFEPGELVSYEEKAKRRPRFKIAEKTNTKAFKDWFGKSKIVDEKGKPRVVYHGTRGDFDEFGMFGERSIMINTLLGFHFAKNPKITDTFTKGLGSVLPVYVKMENPLDLRDTEFEPNVDTNVIAKTIAFETFKRNRQLFEKWLIYKNRSAYNWEKYVEDLYKNKLGEIIHEEFYDPFDGKLNREIINDFLQHTKYDGIIYKNTALAEIKDLPEEERTCYIVFDPKNIKSATANVGTYSPETADIRYKKHIDIAYGSMDRYKENITKAVNEAKKIRISPNKRYKLIDISEAPGEEQAGEYIHKYTGGKTFLDVFKENAIKEKFTTEDIAYDEPLGMIIKSSQDVAQAYSIFRSPYAEKSHVVFARDGKIIASFSETLGLPMASSFTRSFNFTKTLFHYATKYGVNEVYMVHNHPSGHIRPSNADLRITGKIAEDVDSVNAMLKSGRNLWEQGEPDLWGTKIKFKGHVLLDSDKFTFITTSDDIYHNVEYDSYTYKEPKNIPDFYETRITITGRDDVAKVGKQLLTDAKYKGAVIFLASNAAINGFMPLPQRIEYEELDKMISDGLVSRGVSRYIIIHDGSMEQLDGAFWSEECQDVINLNNLKSEKVHIISGKRYLPAIYGKEAKIYVLDKASPRYKKADVRLKKLLSGDLNMSRLGKVQEIFQDRMLSVKLWQDEILRRGGKTSNMTDPWGQENLSYSIIMNAIKDYDKDLLKPLEDTVSKIMMGHNKNLDEVQKYMKVKHAPERNAFLKEKTGKDNNSGFTTEQAQAIIKAFETDINTGLINELWTNIRKATDFVLNRWKNDGFIDQVLYDKIKSRYQYYVPLRGWMRLDDTQELHGYQQSRLTNSVQLNKKAKGRVTESENPLQYIANMAYSAIIVGEKNRVKQHAARLAMVNVGMEDIHRLRKLYLVFTGGFDESGKEIWEERYERPDQKLWDQGMVQLKIQDTDNQARKTRSEAKQHEAEVWFNGEKQVLVFPDTNPIAPATANALNKRNDLYGELTGFTQNTIGKVTRQLVFNFTAKNPAFFPVNQIRDVGYAALSHFVYGDTQRGAKFMANLSKARAAIIRHVKGKTDPIKNETDKMYRDFMISGGETGYIHMRDIDQLTSDIQKDIKRLIKTKNLADKAWETVWIKGGKMMENLAIRSENLSRFATYLTMIQEGKTPREAAKAAKDITVNFNRKGRISGLLGSIYAFFNANLQGGENIIRMARKNGVKYSIVAVGFMSLGFINALFASLWSGDDDEDGKEDYSQLNDYLKYNYLCIPVTKGKFITIPLPFGWRFFHSLGVLAYQNTVSDEKKIGESIRQGLVNMFESISPVNPIDLITPNNEISFRPLVPTAFVPAYDLTINEDFAGNRIFKQPFTQAQKGRLADSQMGMPYVNKIIKWITDTAFKLGGGDPELETKFRFNKEGNVIFDKKGEVVKVSEFYDWNPSKTEYLIEYYLGGRGKFWNNILKTGTGIITGAYEAATGNREFKQILDDVRMYNIPIIRRLVREAWARSIYDEYYNISEIMEDYHQAKNNREMVYGEVSEEVGERKYELWKSYKKDIDSVNDEIKETDDPGTLERLRQQKEELMEDFIKEYKKKSNIKEKENETE